MVDEKTEKIKKIMRTKEPTLSEEEVEKLANQLIWLAELAVKNFVKTCHNQNKEKELI